MYLLITKVASELEIENMDGNIVFDDQYIFDVSL